MPNQAKFASANGMVIRIVIVYSDAAAVEASEAASNWPPDGVDVHCWMRCPDRPSAPKSRWNESCYLGSPQREVTKEIGRESGQPYSNISSDIGWPNPWNWTWHFRQFLFLFWFFIIPTEKETGKWFDLTFYFANFESSCRLTRWTPITPSHNLFSFSVVFFFF